MINVSWEEAIAIGAVIVALIVYYMFFEDKNRGGGVATT